ncbi:VOC family protein [Phytoactinopolyspora mesophila]|uniref:VOC family protein n=1 Tax=Phytoactinopolyspora mesophila TaxID=2650750 RepID=A0A7K3LYC6_9ACTN|nr:VOC family protein [Phytoactinopolyspora mesophila]NDL56016.1 VOC family protein [Phytoactinopolyspora mesophila]
MNKVGNITFDCADPRALSHFWSDVLGYPRSEYPPELRESLLQSGLTEEDLLDRSVAEDPEGAGPRLYFHRVAEPKQAKNRVHLDLFAIPGKHATPAEIDAEVDRIVALGASVIRKHDALWGPYREYHYVMADPEGNEFCIQ